MAKLTVWCSFCLAHQAAVPTPPAGLAPLLVVLVPLTPQAARNAPMPRAPAPAPAERSISRRDSRRWVSPRQIDGSMPCSLSISMSSSTAPGPRGADPRRPALGPG